MENYRVRNIINVFCSWIKKEKKHFIIFAVLLVLILIQYYVAKFILDKKMDFKHITEISPKIMICIKSVDEDGNNLELSGYIISDEYSEKENKWEILLYDTEKKEIVYPTKIKKIDYIDGLDETHGYNHDYSDFGLWERFKLNFFKMQVGNYELLVKDGNKKGRKLVYKTGLFIRSGKIVQKGENAEKLVTGLAELDEIIQSGLFLTNNQEEKIYLVLNNNKLYWIWDRDQAELFAESRRNMVHLFTVKESLLSEERKKYGFENADFLFSDMEKYELETEQFRVAVIDIPKDYHYIDIGQYLSEDVSSVWSESLYINYD